MLLLELPELPELPEFDLLEFIISLLKTEYKRLNSADVNKHLSNNDVTVVCDKCKKNILFEDCIETIDHRTLCEECFDNEEPTRLD